MFLAVTNVIGPVLLIVIVGYLYAKRQNADMAFVNRANMDVFVPALIFSGLTGGTWSFEALGPMLIVAAVIIMLPGLLSIPVLKILKLDYRVVAPPIMFNNSGNLGVPLIVFAFGEAYLPFAVLLFIVETFLHFTAGMMIINRGKGFLTFVRSPIIWATVLAIVFHETETGLPLALERGIELLGEIAIPLMLFGLGTRMHNTIFSGFKLPLVAGIWVPVSGAISAAIALFVFDLTLGLDGTDAHHQSIIWLYAILPPAVLNYLVSERYLDTDAEKQQVAELVLWGNVTCLLPLIVILALVL